MCGLPKPLVKHGGSEGLSVILPVKRPEPYLKTLYGEIDQTLKVAGIEHEILVQEEQGLTTAVVEGVKNSKFPNIVVMDADGSHNPKYLTSMYRLLNFYDVVVGFKFKDGSPCSRRAISFLFRAIANLILRLKMIDPMSGFVMGQKKVFEKIKPSADYKFILQILVSSPKVKEIPIIFSERKLGKSHANYITGFRTLAAILRLWAKKHEIGFN